MSGEALGSLAGLVPFGTDALVRDALPPHPLLALPAVTIPRPPLLTREMTQAHRALMVVRAYLGAVTAKGHKTKLWHGYKINAVKPADITASSSYAKLTELADLFLEHEVAPAAWAAWRLRVVTHDKEGNPRPDAATPNLFSLMSKTWLTTPNRRGWFRRDAGSLYCGASIEPPVVARLRTRWDAMLAEVYASKPQDAAMVQAIFESFFPNDALALSARRAAAEIDSLKLQYMKRAGDGEWLW